MTEQQAKPTEKKKKKLFTIKRVFWSFMLVLTIAVGALVGKAYIALNTDLGVGPTATASQAVGEAVEEWALHSGHENLPVFTGSGQAGKTEEASGPSLDDLLADDATAPKTKPTVVATNAVKGTEVKPTNVVEPVNTPKIRKEKIVEVRKAPAEKKSSHEIDNLF